MASFTSFTAKFTNSSANFFRSAILLLFFNDCYFSKIVYNNYSDFSERIYNHSIRRSFTHWLELDTWMLQYDYKINGGWIVSSQYTKGLQDVDIVIFGRDLFSGAESDKLQFRIQYKF